MVERGLNTMHRHFAKGKIGFLSLAVVLGSFSIVGCGSRSGDFKEGREVSSTPNSTIDSTDTELGQMQDDSEQDRAYEEYVKNAKYASKIIAGDRWYDADGKVQYPAEYKKNAGFVPSDSARMAAQQIPNEVLQGMSTIDLLELIMDYPGSYSIIAYDTYDAAMEMYRDYYNFIDMFCNRKDAKEAIDEKYDSYTEEEIKKNSKSTHISTGNENKRDKFQMLEALKENCIE